MTEAALRGRPCRRTRTSSDPSRSYSQFLQLQFEQKLALQQHHRVKLFAVKKQLFPKQKVSLLYNFYYQFICITVLPNPKLFLCIANFKGIEAQFFLKKWHLQEI